MAENLSSLRISRILDEKIDMERGKAGSEVRGDTAEAPIEIPSLPTPAAPSPTRPKKGWRNKLRPVIFALLPVALVYGGYLYVTGGQVMSTDNAYVQADMVGVSTDVSGTVLSIEVQNNELVKKGQVLFRLDPASFEIALAGAKAQLGTVRNQVLTLQASYALALAQIEQAKADIPFFQVAFKRQQDLQSSSAASKANFDSAKHDFDAANQKVLVAQSSAKAMLAQLGGDAALPLEQNPFYLQAQSAVQDAERDLNDTIVRAPFDGIVTNVPALQAGSYLRAAQTAFSLVSTTHVWIAASPKETELTYVRPGQAVSVSVDTYPGIAWKGTIGSISPASGSSFSMLPAQNTTGNWVKVVQRIPMIVSLDDLSDRPPLRVGMSVTVDVDTGHARGLPDFVEQWLGDKSKNK